MQIYRKRMQDIGKGELVAGDVTGWWRVTRADIDRNGSVVLTGTSTADSRRTGTLWGNARDYRDLAG